MKNFFVHIVGETPIEMMPLVMAAYYAGKRDAYEATAIFHSVPADIFERIDARLAEYLAEWRSSKNVAVSKENN